MSSPSRCSEILGKEATQAIAKAKKFLQEHDTAELLNLVGTTVHGLSLPSPAADKHSFPVAYGGGKPCDADLLTGSGLFYITEKGKVMLDCTSGHYQMTWGYNHPELTAAAEEAMRMGIVWDNHSNIPSLPVKLLADKLVGLAGDAGLDRVLLGVSTGSAACGAALKIMLTRYFNDPERNALGPPVIVSLLGNYHGTDIAAQTMRGMWPGLLARMETVQIEPNDAGELRAAFERFGKRIAGFWAEPILMNREAMLVETPFLELARRLCTAHGALMILDEIQTGFWYPEVFMFRRLGIAPDMVIVGKGMTAGFHPLAGVLFRSELDILEQYDAISTNGNASLAAFVALANLRLIEQQRDRIAALSARHFDGLCRVASEFPDLIERVNGAGFLTGIRFRDREDALGFHKAAVERGLWLRAHAYHPGHRTVLTKCALATDEQIVDFTLNALRTLMQDRPWQ